MQGLPAAKSPLRERGFSDKLFYKIGEVSKMTGVEPYVLRYWESEFPFLRPRKSKSGQRVYVKKDLELIANIKNLLYEERYTVEGVRKRLGEVPAGRRPQREILSSDRAIEHVKVKLREILNRLK